VSVKARTLIAARHGRAERGVAVRRKRYCRRCKTRVGRSAGRCGYCGERLLNPTRLALVTTTAIAVLLLLGRFAGLF
jgi:uncharacterized paraquat-inducible protein A